MISEEIKILSFEEDTNDYGNSIVQYQRGTVISFMFTPAEVTGKTLDTSMALAHISQFSDEDKVLWSNVSEELLALIQESDHDMLFIELDNEDWNEECSKRILEEASKHGLGLFFEGYNPKDSYLTVYAGTMGAIDWSGHEVYGTPCLMYREEEM